MGDADSAVDLASLAAAGDRPGALWRLDGEDLQANLIRLGSRDRIGPHRNDEVEVLMVVVAGQGELTRRLGGDDAESRHDRALGQRSRAGCLGVGAPEDARKRLRDHRVGAGRGELTLDGQVHPLAPMALVHVPKGTVRAVVAVDGPLAYLSVHRRRSSGLQVGRHAPHHPPNGH